MDAIIGTIGLILRLPFWAIGTVLAVIWTVGFGGLSALWFYLAIPALWVVFGVPAAFFAVSFGGRRNASAQLSKRLSDDVQGWKTHTKYHFSEIFGLHKGLNKWLINGSGRNRY